MKIQEKEKPKSELRNEIEEAVKEFFEFGGKIKRIVIENCQLSDRVFVGDEADSFLMG